MARLSDEEIVRIVIALNAQADTVRGTLDSHLEEIAKRIAPSYSGSFHREQNLTPGQKRTEEMVDATGALALSRSASALESMLTPTSSLWHGMAPVLKSLLKDRRVREWFQDLQRIVFQYRYAPRANFASQKRADYLALMAFGTSSLYTDKPLVKGEKGLRYRYVHLGEVKFMANHQGIVDTAIRRFRMTARQMLQRWGRDRLPSQILSDAEDPKKGENEHWVIHCVKPRGELEGFEPGRVDELGLQFADYYVSETGMGLIINGGHHTFPYSVSRYDVAPGELYGRSPAMDALPSMKVLNEQKKTVLKHGHRAVAPALLAHDDGIVDTFSVRPDAINFGGVTAEGRPLIQAIPTGKIQIGKELMDMEKETINDFFLVSLFEALVNNPQMTATQVLELTRERGVLLSPTVGRHETEALGPMIEREVDLLIEQRLVAPMPEALREVQGEYEIEYNSPLSRARRAEEASGLFRTLDWMTGIINHYSGSFDPGSH